MGLLVARLETPAEVRRLEKLRSYVVGCDWATGGMVCVTKVGERIWIDGYESPPDDLLKPLGWIMDLFNRKGLGEL